MRVLERELKEQITINNEMEKELLNKEAHIAALTRIHEEFS